jgi:hypothetical protein
MTPNEALRALKVAFAAALFLALSHGRVSPAAAAVTASSAGIRFAYTDPAASGVAWVGDYNGWNTTANPMSKDASGAWTITLPLPPGEHAYKFVVDGNYIADPDNPETKGEYGNSVITVAADGTLTGGAAAPAAPPTGTRDLDPARGASQVRSNTPYSAKLEFHGRGIGLYESSFSDERDRFELRRPRLELDLDTGIRISEVLTARWLMKISSETEVNFYETNLNLDRGNITFRGRSMEIFAYDNEAAGTWDDPLHLVGDVGIYGYDYGYDRQGFRVRPRFGAFEGELHYADNFRAGDALFPGGDPDLPAALAASLRGTDDGAGGFVFPGRSSATGGATVVSDVNEDMIALRARRRVGPILVGLLGRADRGFDLSNGAFAFASGGDEVRVVTGPFEHTWYGYGAEGRWTPGPAGLELFAEVLQGRLLADFRPTSERVTFRAAFDDTGTVSGLTEIARDSDGANESATLDRSRRLALGGRWARSLLGAPAGFAATASYMDHDDRIAWDGLESADRDRRSTWSVRARWDQSWSAVLTRALETILDVEWQGFDYRADDPWDAQFWFARRNFWLEHEGGKVSPDRIVLLGGRDVWTFRPEIRVPILPERNCAFEYAGRIHSHSLTTRPKVIESFFRLGYDLTPSLRAQTDTRWIKYDDPTLALHSGYVDHFAELAYTFAPGIQLALSWGVDPWVLDRATNGYAYRGRDDALVAAGVTSTAARDAYLQQGPVIAAAERALRDRRRIAVEAIVRF